MAEFYVKVETDSEQFQIKNKGAITNVSLTEKAENGRANAELVKHMEKILDQKPAIISGHHSRRKKLKVDISEKELERKLEERF